MRIQITNQSSLSRIPVGIQFKTNAPTYAESMAISRNLKIKSDMGYIKQIIPDWYKKAMDQKRNQIARSL